jgi:uncharacterized protein with FMN-binding domain/flavin-binding protein dodecin
MKKFTKTIMAVAVLAALSASAFGLAACGGNNNSNGGEEKVESKTAQAYGLTHYTKGAFRFVGCADITTKGTTVTELTLNEVYLPDQITITGTSKTSADDAKAAVLTTNNVAADDVVVLDTVAQSGTDEITYTATAYYKTIKYSNYTFTYDTTNGYADADGTTLLSLMSYESEAKTYYDAVMNNSLNVVIGTANNTTIMGKAKMSKDDNGYWPKEDKDGNDYSRWQVNRDNTVKYVKENGVAHLLSLTKAAAVDEDPLGKAETKTDTTYTEWVDGTIKTGATWNDLNPATKSVAGYLTYAELITKAYAKANGTVYEGEYKYTNYGTNYGIKVQVTVYDGKIVNVALVKSDLVRISPANETYHWYQTDVDNYLTNEASLLEAYKGKKVSDIKAITVAVKKDDDGNDAEPYVKDDEEFKAYDSDLILTGATQCSSRLLKAVQNALANA